MATSIEIIEKGKVLYITKDFLLIAKGYKLYKWYILDRKFRYYCSIIDNNIYPLLSKFKLTRRLFRAEVATFYKTEKYEFCVAKKGLFRKLNSEKNFTKIHKIGRGSRPLNMCFDKGKMFYGEYFANINKDEVYIYCSEDDGESWVVKYTFKRGEINHIHGIFKDPYQDKIWVVTGDRENECIIGCTEDHFETFNEVFRGEQQFRTCKLFFYKEFITFVTDSQYEENKIRRFDRNSFVITDIITVQGSVIKGVQSGNTSMFSTAIEPSTVNIDKEAHIWLSTDGNIWKEVAKDKKDCYSMFFQIGTFEFPEYCQKNDNCTRFYFTGKALLNTDNKICVIDNV